MSRFLFRSSALGLAALFAACSGEPLPETPTESVARPTERLVVMVVVDQLVPWQLERLEPWLDGGLGRFVREGQVWSDAEHAHGITQTGPGHATIATGVVPARHGIIANSWRDYEGKEWNCVTDPNVKPLTSAGITERGRPASGWRLRVPGISDYVRAAYPDAKTVGISGKDRAAILGAAGADWSLWWDTEGTGFASSTAFGAELPGWVTEWNREWWKSDSWNPDRLEDGRVVWHDELPPGVDDAGTAPDERAGEDKFFGRTTLPHTSPSLSPEPGEGELAAFAAWIKHSPAVDQFTLDLAMSAVRNMRLGADDSTDVLFLGLSGCDVLGHTFGPRSREVTDLLLRTDRALDVFFDVLDKEVGKDQWIAVMTSDHGVLELPEATHARGVGAVRTKSSSFREPGGKVAEILDVEFAKGLVQHIDTSGIRLSARRIRDAGLDSATVRQRARELFLSHSDVLRRAFTAEELSAPGALESGDDVLRWMAASFYPGRSSDVMFVHQPNHIPWATGTTHGSPWAYDRKVPLVFLGDGSPAETRDQPCRSVDILPTLLSRAGIDVPEGLDGRVLPPGAKP